VSTLPERDGLSATWQTPAADLTPELHTGHEPDEQGHRVRNLARSGRHQIAVTDVYCQITEQIGHLAGMSVAVTMPSFGIKLADVVWVSSARSGDFDLEHPLPFVPDICAEVLIDSHRVHQAERLVNAYLAGGAREVIIVDQFGQVHFMGPKGPRQTSIFGVKLSIDPLCRAN